MENPHIYKHLSKHKEHIPCSPKTPKRALVNSLEQCCPTETMCHRINFKWFSSHIKKSKYKWMKLNNILYLTQYTQNIISICNR